LARYDAGVTGGTIDLFAYLGRTERGRLDRFADRFDELSPAEYSLFAGPIAPDAHLEAAIGVARGEVGTGLRHNAIKAAVDRFRETALRRYAERWSVGELLGLRQIAPASAADRVRVLRSLERAVAALILWDRLDDGTRVALAGPWADLVEASL
jgi:hypothetical protein